MARQPDDLSLDAGLIRKGEARGLHPTTAQQLPETPPERASEPPGGMVADASPPPHPRPTRHALRAVPRAPTVEPPADDPDEPPLKAAPPEIEPLRFTSF